LKDIALASVTSCREEYDLRDENGMFTEGTVTCDGEQIVMNEVLINEVVEPFTDQEVTVAKLSASCSGILQASDRAKTFMASKKRLRTIVQDDIDVSNPVLDNNLKKAFKQLEDKYNIKVPSGKEECIIYGCKAVMRTLSDTVKPHVISDGFKVTGQYPLNLELMLDQSYADIDEELRQRMNARLEHDLSLFREQGYLTEAQYEASGIPTNDDPDSKPRDERGLHNQRAMLLTHPKTVERRQLKLSNGVDLDDIMTAGDMSKEELKELEAATKLIANDEKGKNKKRKDQERRETQTEEAKKSEQLEKKQKTAATRKQKADNLANAHTLVANKKRGESLL